MTESLNDIYNLFRLNWPGVTPKSRPIGFTVRKQKLTHRQALRVPDKVLVLVIQGEVVEWVTTKAGNLAAVCAHKSGDSAVDVFGTLRSEGRTDLLLVRGWEADYDIWLRAVELRVARMRQLVEELASMRADPARERLERFLKANPDEASPTRIGPLIGSSRETVSKLMKQVCEERELT